MLTPLLRQLLADERGQDLIEYALLTSAIGFAGIAAWEGVRTAIGTTYGAWETNVNDLWEPDPPASVGS